MAKKTAKKKAAPKATTKKATTKKATPKKKAPETPTFVQRPDDIKGIHDMRWVVASTLKGHPENWKTHTDRQLKALKANIGDEPGKGVVGWAGAVLYNERTNRIVDGHGRLDVYKDDPNAVVPVMVGQWTEEEERQILLQLDPIAAMFETNTTKFNELMEKSQTDLAEKVDDMKEEHVRSIEALNQDLKFQADYIEAGGESTMLPSVDAYRQFEMDKGTTETVELKDVKTDLDGQLNLKHFSEIFPADWEGLGQFDIPHLHPDMIPVLSSGDGAAPNIKVWVGPETEKLDNDETDYYYYIYGSAAIEKVRTARMIVSFYTYDGKFEAIWNDPTKFTARMLNLKIPAVTTVDFTYGSDWWFAHDIWQIFRSRWLGRYWQQLGLQVIPNISWNGLFKEDHEKLILGGLPKNPNCVSIQVQSKFDADPEAFMQRAKVAAQKIVHKLEPKQLLIYHSPNIPEDWYDSLRKNVDDLILVPTWMSQRRNVLKQKEYMTGDVK